MLGVIQCRRFSGGTYNDQRIRAVFDLVFDQALERIIVDLSVFLHGCDKGNTGSFKDRHIPYPPHI